MRIWLVCWAIVGAATFGMAQGGRPEVFSNFVGSTPASEAIRPLLGIPAEDKADLMEWRLTLYRDSKTGAPAAYRLHVEYGPAVANVPGLGRQRKTVVREGRWATAKGTASNPEAVVYELNGAVSLFEVSPDVVQILNSDRSLMIGNGGWSYTLNRAEAAEKPGDAALAAVAADEPSRTVSPLATGPSVFGVFEGRSPCHGVLRQLNIPERTGCRKAKWRLTLYRDPKTLAPTNYKLEGTIHRRGAREGIWTIVRDREGDSAVTVYRLAAVDGERALSVLRGDDNVLFFSDSGGRPLVGNAEYSYTLNRRNTEPNHR